MVSFRIMTGADVDAVLPIYIGYYNAVDGRSWTEERARSRIRQIVTIDGGCSLLAETESGPAGFVMGYFNQYDDLTAYDLVEVVVAAERQNKGLGTALLRELETRVRERGATMIQLQAVNDDMHRHFYGDKLGYKETHSLVPMTKWL